MSYFSFISTPEKLGICSCVDGGSVEIPLLTHQDILNHCKSLQNCNNEIINQQANKGKIILVGKVITQTGYLKQYPINDNWSFEAVRAAKDAWFYVLKPATLTATYNFKVGMQKIARKHLTTNADIDVWVRYEKLSKIFYLKEFGEVIKKPDLIRAIMNYTELFDKEEYKEWLKHHEWPYQMSYAHRLYMKRQVQQWSKQKKKQNK